MIEELTHPELLNIKRALENKRLQLIRPNHNDSLAHGSAESRTVELVIEKARLENIRATLKERQGFERQLTARRTGFTRAL